MKSCTITLKDYVNAQVTGLDTKTLTQCHSKLSYLLPQAFHVPAFKLGRWDGKVSFFNKTNGSTYINHLPKVIDIIKLNGYEIELECEIDFPSLDIPEVKTDMFIDRVWPEQHIFEGEPIRLRDDQAEAANIFLKARTGVMCLATSYGKTMLTATIANALAPWGRSLTIVPNTSLVEQTLETFLDVGLDAGGIHGKRKEFGHQHTITTWQSLANVLDSEDDEQIHAIIDDLILVVGDEVHQAKDASVLNELLKGHLCEVPYRLGLTGTMPKEDYNSLAIEGVIGPLIHRVSAKTLQDKGILAKCVIYNLVTKEDRVFKNYVDETNYLNRNMDRHEMVSRIVDITRNDGNTLILVDSIDIGKTLNELIEDSTFIYGKVKQKDRSETYKGVHKQENSVIIATYQVAAVGINIPRIFNLIILEPGKSFIRVIQSIGRAVRVAKDKDFARVFDISSDTKYSKKHITERKKFYLEAEYPYELFKGNYDDTIESVKRIIARERK